MEPESTVAPGPGPEEVIEEAAPAAEAPEAAMEIEKPEAVTSAADDEPPTGEEEEKKEAASASEKKSNRTPKAKATPGPTPASAEGDGRVKRERKSVQHFSFGTPKADTPKVMHGKGTKLRDIPNVAFKMSKIKGKDELVEGLHNLLFRRKGVAHLRKKGVLDFAGFEFEEGQEDKEIEARRGTLGKWKLELIHKAMDTMDVTRGSGDKAAKIDRLLDFLKKPSQLSEVDLAARESAKREKDKRKRERAAAKEKDGKKGSVAKNPAKKKAKKAAESEEDSSEEDSSEEEESAGEQEEAAFSKKKPAAFAKPMVIDDETDDEEEEEDSEEKKKEPTPKKKTPTPKKSPAVPKKSPKDPAAELTSEKLKADVEAYLESLNEEELGGVTPNTLLAAMTKTYGFPVKSRKKEIKELMSAWADARAEAVEEMPAEEDAAEPEKAVAEEEEQPKQEEAAVE